MFISSFLPRKEAKAPAKYFSCSFSAKEPKLFASETGLFLFPRSTGDYAPSTQFWSVPPVSLTHKKLTP